MQLQRYQRTLVAILCLGSHGLRQTMPGQEKTFCTAALSSLHALQVTSYQSSALSPLLQAAVLLLDQPRAAALLLKASPSRSAVLALPQIELLCVKVLHPDRHSSPFALGTPHTLKTPRSSTTIKSSKVLTACEDVDSGLCSSSFLSRRGQPAFCSINLRAALSREEFA